MDSIQRSEATLEEALEIVGCGSYTNLLALVGGLLTMSAMCMAQGMYYVQPAIGCEFHLEQGASGFVASSLFIGSMLSSTWWGFLVDFYGRRRVLLATTLGSSLSVFLGSLAPSSGVFTLANLVMGFMLGGVLGNPYVYVSEFVPARDRPRKLIIIAVVSSFANVYSPSAAWSLSWLDIDGMTGNAFRSWRVFLLVNSLPMFVTSLILLLLPESPKFLLSKGRQEDAIRSLSRVFAANYKRKVEDFPVCRLRLDLEDVSGPKADDEKTGFINFILTLFVQIKELFTPPLLVYTIICSIMKFAVIGLYSVIYLWVPDEANRLLKYSNHYETYNVTLCEVMSRKEFMSTGNCNLDSEIYLIIICVGLMYSAACIAMTFVVRVVDLKVILGINITAASGVCLATLFLTSFPLTLFSLGLLVAILASSQPAVFGILVYFFPTKLRATATAVCVVFGRLAIPISVYLLGRSFAERCNLAYYTISAVLAGIGVLCFFTPSKKKTQI